MPASQVYLPCDGFVNSGPVSAHCSQVCVLALCRCHELSVTHREACEIESSAALGDKGSRVVVCDKLSWRKTGRLAARVGEVTVGRWKGSC